MSLKKHTKMLYWLSIYFLFSFNILLTFNLFFIFFYFSFPSTFTLDFLSITFSLKISEKGVKLWLPNLNHARFMIWWWQSLHPNGIMKKITSLTRWLMLISIKNCPSESMLLTGFDKSPKWFKSIQI